MDGYLVIVIICVQFADYKCYALTASLQSNPRLERSVALFNGVTQWVQCMVLSRTTPQQRASVVSKFVGVAKVALSITTVPYTNAKVSLPSLRHSSG